MSSTEKEEDKYIIFTMRPDYSPVAEPVVFFKTLSEAIAEKNHWIKHEGETQRVYICKILYRKKASL